MNKRKLEFFWAKTDQTAQGEPCAKQVSHHLIDVAAVAWVWLDQQPQWCLRLSAQLGLEPVSFKAMVAFLAGLHDLGKFSRTFQSLSAEHWPPRILGPFTGPIGGPRHWELTARLLFDKQVAEPFYHVFGRTMSKKQLIAITAGHHGVAPCNDLFHAEYAQDRNSLCEHCRAAASQAIDTLVSLLKLQPLPKLSGEALANLSVTLNGIITLCDWVGSDSEFFPIHHPDTNETTNTTVTIDARTRTDQAYWIKAQSAALMALRHKGLIAVAPASHPSYRSLGLACATSPRPMQHAATQIQLTDGPQLVVIEDTTGAGKTEAALLIAARMMAAGKGEGLYFALPTMATANAMNHRLSQAAAAMFAPGTEPSQALLHAKARLAERLTAQTAKSDQAAQMGEDPVSAWCNNWIASNRRLGLLADVGVGTIDQAFLAILRKRHVSMRQAALSRRILVVDEAHAFDAYMGQELQTLLQAHANNGGSSIVLSATLDEQSRAKLIKSICGQAMSPPCQPGDLAPYPLLTHADRVRYTQDAPGFDDRLRRRVKLQRLDTRQASVDQAQNAANNGAAVVIICNAVDEAIAIFEQLSHQNATPDDVLLFHARFAVGDRLAIEQRVLTLFGRNGDPTARGGKILVATQVVEQSLDLDFDLVISDLAPVDLLIQRAGRLWRHLDLRPAHARPTDAPTLMIVSPDPARAVDPGWLDQTLGKAAFVYRDPATLWCSAAALFSRDAIQTPEDFRPLLAQVYGPSPHQLAYPDFLTAPAQQAEGEMYAATTLAQMNVLNLARGYIDLGPAPGQDQEVGTRLGDETETIRLVKCLGEHMTPYHDSQTGDLALDWELSSVTLRRRAWLSVQDQALSGPHVDAVRAQWPQFDQQIPLVAVGDAQWGLVYCQRMGARIIAPESED